MDLNGQHDCQLSLREADGTFLLRWIHRDAAQGHILWHNLVRLTANRASVIVEHGVARSAPRDTVLKPLSACPKILSTLIDEYGGRVQPKELCTDRPSNLGVRDVGDFARHVLLDRTRAAPVVLVTPTKEEGTLLVDPEKLATSLVGMASVAVVREKDATYQLSDTLSRRGFDRTFSCFDGGVRVYEGPLEADQSPYQHRLWLRKRIEGLDSAQRQAIISGEIAARLVARSMPLSYGTILGDFDKVQKRRVAEALLANVALADARGESDAAVQELRTQLDDALQLQDFLDREYKQAEEELAKAKESIERLQRERDERSSYIDDIQRQFDEVKRARERGGIGPELASALQASFKRTATVEQALMTVAALYPERVLVLDSAWRSAKQSVEFKYPEKAFALLLLLAGDYWDALASGRGDTEARKVFGKSYASSESEVSESNKTARGLRTFRYENRGVEMFQHLKIGVKDSVYETWRTHFFWDAANRRIVIGYCGPHLNLR